MSQDCDLEQDYKSRKNNSNNHDKFLDMILICPAYPSEQFLTGIHLKDRKMRSNFGKTELNKLKTNELSRYHYMDIDLNFNVPSLVVDFKHFFTVPRETIYEQYGLIYLGTISEL